MANLDFLTQYETNRFTRTTTTFVKDSGTSIKSDSLLDMGAAFILLSAEADNTECRLRLYSNQSSLNTDVGRPLGNFNLTESVALIADIFLTGSNSPRLVFNPPIIGNTFVGGQLWYSLSASSAVRVSVTVESFTIRPIADGTDGDIDIIISASAVPTTGNGISGSIATSKSFLILSASATSESRLRLYSRPHTEIPATEKSRAFGTEPQSGSLLIADLMFDSASFQYPLVPILEAYTWTATNYAVGSGQVGYILQNRSAGTANITASIYAYSLEN